MNALLRLPLMRLASVPQPYLAPRDVTVTSTDCPHCNPTARAIQIVIARWVVAGIDKGE